MQPTISRRISTKRNKKSTTLCSVVHLIVSVLGEGDGFPDVARLHEAAYYPVDHYRVRRDAPVGHLHHDLVTAAAVLIAAATAYTALVEAAAANRSVG